MTYGKTITVRTPGFSDIINISGLVAEAVAESNITNGIAAVTALGSTASVTTMEYEPALKEDMKDMLERLIPGNSRSRHGQTWGDDNGFSHMRATLMGPGTVIPVVNGELLAGTWQQVVVIDHDNRPRNREIRIQVMGD